jgi:hypothetical protein
MINPSIIRNLKTEILAVRTAKVRGDHGSGPAFSQGRYSPRFGGTVL